MRVKLLLVFDDMLHQEGTPHVVHESASVEM